MTPVERLMCFVELWRNRSNPRGINASKTDTLAQVYGSRGAVALTIDDIESVVAENVTLRAQLAEERRPQAERFEQMQRLAGKRAALRAAR